MSKRRCISRRTSDDVLPVELIHRIQSLLPLTQGGRTCILSKSWLRAWYTLPTLKFSDRGFSIYYNEKENETNFNKLIRTTLERYHLHNTPIQSFHLELSLIENDLRSLEDLNYWIRLVGSNTCLKHLSLDIRVLLCDDDDDRYESVALSNNLFSSRALHTIHVTAASSEDVSNLCLRICSTNVVINCLSLRVLDLECIFIDQDVLNNVLSTCRLLEKIKLARCGGLKNVKVQNLLHLTDLDILSTQDDDLWEINNVPSLSSFRYSHRGFSTKPVPFQLDPLAGVTHLCIEGDLIFNNSFLQALEHNLTVLESLTIVIENPDLKDLVLSSASLKWLTLNIYPTSPVVNLQVYAPKLLSFIYTGRIPGLLFRSSPPEQVKLTFYLPEQTLGHSYFLRMREALNSSSKFDIKIKSSSLDSLVRCSNIDVDDLRSRVLLFPVGNVELELETWLGEDAWEESRFLDALFLICHPTYIRSSYQVIRLLMMEGNTADQLKEVLLKNPDNGNWEALTSSRKRVLHRYIGHLECKLIWSA